MNYKTTDSLFVLNKVLFVTNRPPERHDKYKKHHHG